MILRQFFEPESCTYTYLIADSESREALFIDPVLESLDSYNRILHELDLKLLYALDTHIHADHITAAGHLKDATGCSTLNGEALECSSDVLKGGMAIKLGSLTLKAMFTPGHTDNSYTFILKHNGTFHLFTGDTLFIRGTGRTDFQNGSSADLYDSLKKLCEYPRDSIVYPGHDYKGWTISTIGEEIEHNPRLQCENREEFITLMSNLKLPNPKQMDIAVPANLKCGKVS